MAGGAAKKAAARQRSATLLYVGIAVAVNVVYVLLRFGVRREWLSRSEVAGVLFLLGLYVLALFSIVQSAAMGVGTEIAVDVFALAAAVQLGQETRCVLAAEGLESGQCELEPR